MKKLIYDQLASVYRISPNNIKMMAARGVDVHDAREVVKDIKASSRKPEPWADVFGMDEDTKEFWAREKVKEEVKSLRLKNSKVSGEMLDRADADMVMDAIAAALKLWLAEEKATSPQLLAGKDEVWISDWMETQHDKMLIALSDLGSGLMQKIYDKYAQTEGPSNAEEVGDGNQATPTTQRKRVVRTKRKPDSGTDS